MRLSRKWTPFLLALTVAVGMLSAQSNLDIEGAGFFQNRALKSRLAFLQSLEPGQAADLDAAMLEDSAFLLLEQLKREGYMQPVIRAELREGEGTRTAIWSNPYSIQLDADAHADSVTFQLEPGVMAYYKSVLVEGISQIEAEGLERYFIPGGALWETRKTKVFTPENLDRRISRVLRSLDALGYREAQLVSSAFDLDPLTGAVSVDLQFEQGARHYVGQVALTTLRDGGESRTSILVDPEAVLTPDWEQAQRTDYRNEAYEAGYPDASVSLLKKPTTSVEAGRRVVDVDIQADWGSEVRFAGVRFVGDPATKRSLLERQLKMEPGDPMSLIEANETRRKIVGLGIFKKVDMAFDSETDASRELVYTLEPSVRKELKVLAGWGSYELLRAGFKWDHRNPFGRAHRYEVEAKQSFKSSRAQMTYSIPQIFGTDLLLYSDLEYSFREELSYDRTKQGASVGASYITAGGVRLSAEYGFFQEEADRDDDRSFESEEDATVASLSLSVSYDQRDDFLAPSSGWIVYSEFKIADRWLGGSVSFQKLELGGSYHFSLSDSTLVHLGLRGGTILTAEDTEDNIPFNERFFSGGENSVRGYREGAASPLDVGGDEVGAETYALFNLEFEQRVYSRLSAVLFFDSVLNARDGFFDGDESALSSIGLGLRYQTVIGPLRLEYGHNLNPRELDPVGTLHLSVGFPF